MSQIDGIINGFPLGQTLANIFFWHHESNWLKDCLKYFKPVCCKKQLTLCLINQAGHAQFFRWVYH